MTKPDFYGYYRVFLPQCASCRWTLTWEMFNQARLRGCPNCARDFLTGEELDTTEPLPDPDSEAG